MNSDQFLYAAETWTLFSVNTTVLLQIKWHQFVRNDAITATTNYWSPIHLRDHQPSP